MRIGLIAVMMVVGACGEDADPLQGAWLMDNGACAFALVLNGSGGYEANQVCTLEDRSIGLDAEVGTYTTDAGKLTTVATHATCEDVTKAPQTVAYGVEGDTLRLVTPDGILILKKVPKMPSMGGSGGVAAFGCFMDDKFFPRQLMEVRQ